MQIKAAVQTASQQRGFLNIKVITLYVVLMWCLVVSVLYTGYWLTKIQALGLEWFSRAGSLVVVLGIISGLGGILQEQMLLSRIAFQHRFEILKTRKKLRQMQASADYAQKELESVNQQFENMTDALQAKLKIRAGMLELSLLVLGTLIWGFGDVILLLLTG